MSNIAPNTPCVEHTTTHDSDDSRKPADRPNSEIQLPNDNSDACIESPSDNSEMLSSVEHVSGNNVVLRNNDFYDTLKPTHNSSRDYLQLIRDDHNYLQPTSDVPITRSLRCSREDSGSCLNAANESAAYLQPVESSLHSCRQPVNERPLCTNERIRSYNIVYAEQVEYDQIFDEYMKLLMLQWLAFSHMTTHNHAANNATT
jgi:hypothetical protein